MGNGIADTSRMPKGRISRPIITYIPPNKAITQPDVVPADSGGLIIKRGVIQIEAACIPIEAACLQIEQLEYQ